jgi:pyruvate,water dikinase
MTDVCTFEQIRAGDIQSVGGKGLSLGLLTQAGLPVPPGFCITTAAQRRLADQGPQADSALLEEVRDAYRRLGGGWVAVRSSATAEDGAVTSFAGQQETILGVEGEEQVAAAVARCWASLHGERALAYRRHQGLAESGLAMAVVVQRLVAAECAGVLFTCDPLDPEGRSMLVEASWGLGESVVSGKVTPDRYRLDRSSGALLDQHIGKKGVQVTAAGEEPVASEKQDQPCLSPTHLSELAELGRRVEAYYGVPRDIEWAWAEGRFWLLQARPITTSAADREQVRREEIAALKQTAAPGGTVWSLYNVPEGLAAPTLMTWALVGHLLSRRGGTGLMYADLGQSWQARHIERCVYDLVAGRPYCNLSLEAGLHSSWLPYEYPFAHFKAEPRRALLPRPVCNLQAVGPAFWLLLPLRLPFLFARGTRSLLRLGQLSEHLAGRLRQQILPAFAAEAQKARTEDWSGLDAPALLGRFQTWCRRTLEELARDTLKPTALAAAARGGLEERLRRRLGPERAGEAINELCMGVRPDPESDLGGSLRELLEGRLDRAAFLERFGHRGSQEMELAMPRWSEEPSTLDRQLRAPAKQAALDGPDGGSAWKTIAAEARLSSLERTALEPLVRKMQTYLGLRETGKHYFMLGYALIRRALVELDRRFRLGGGIFYLNPEELPRLLGGEDFSALIAQRRRRRALALSLELPPVLFSDDLEAIGRPAASGADAWEGIPLSAGVVEAPALVLEKPSFEDLPAEPFILVCPSTDPAWMPLFVHAHGLVMESGGVLSHGAIVAREYGLPAIAGLPGVHRRVRTGQRLRVDGGRGTVALLVDKELGPRPGPTT